jgi:hypothetical protein
VRIRRRKFLGALALGGIWAAWAGQARAWLPAAGNWTAAPRLLAVLDRPESAAAVGRAYLASHPGEADRDRLAARLDQAVRCQDCDPARARTEQLREALAGQIRADFAAARVVTVDGWVLSETEARLCGLAALSAA